MAVLRCLHPSHTLRRLFMLTLILLLCLQGQVYPTQASEGSGNNKIFIPIVTTQNSQPPAAAGDRLATFGAVYCAVTSASTVQCWGNPIAGWSGKIFAAESNVPVTIAGLSGVKSVSVGDGFACVLTTAGGVKCWGNNVSGQLGNGTQTSSSTPVNVTGMSSGVKQIAVGGLFACALLNTGAVKCWGNNTTGQLGIGNITNQSTPTQVNGLNSGISMISAGERHACAVKSGALSCWGSSEFGQVGGVNLELKEFWIPTPVRDMASGVSTVAAAEQHTCALKSGALICWGKNRGGELGVGYDKVDVWLPTNVVGLLSGVKFVHPGLHSCVILNGGDAKCMGWNTYGELGTGAQSEYSVTPVTVKGISGAVEIETGQYSTCALLNTGNLMCWGSNVESQLGAGLTSNLSLVPVTVMGW